MGSDPIADQFAWVSPYNYAENSPVRYIDLWGLQKAIYDNKAVNNSTFLSAQDVNRQTSGGKRFEKALKSQDKIDVVYAIATSGAEGITAGPFKSFDEFKQGRSESHNLYYATEDNWQDYESYFEEGNEVMVITTMCNDNCTDDEVRAAAQTVNHEEVAHGINRLEGIDKTGSQEHKDFNGRHSIFSPSLNKIKNDPRYKNSEAKRQLDEIDNILQGL